MSQAGEINVVQNHPEIPTQFDADVGFAVPLANILNIVGSGTVTTTGAGNTITIDSIGELTWNIVTSADNPVTLVTENGYIPKGAGVVNFVLPAAAAVGDTFYILGYGNLWTVAQNAGQTITIGTATSTPGVGGSISATMVTDSIELLCVTPNTEFYKVDMGGNITIV